MQKLKKALEELDEVLFSLEDKVALEVESYIGFRRRYDDMVRTIRQKEADFAATTKSISARLDNTIEHVERILRN
ncbi:MAG: hypothetical protein FWF23_05840 [Alphaproteobacteria bacterium]|nr:hypothetical protein [Alphaproteobacteria bacterium]MCL2505917.1 hypothetical protein [Alphaproteobacteria bacterium]